MTFSKFGSQSHPIFLHFTPPPAPPPPHAISIHRIHLVPGGPEGSSESEGRNPVPRRVALANQSLGPPGHRGSLWLFNARHSTDSNAVVFEEWHSSDPTALNLGQVLAVGVTTALKSQISQAALQTLIRQYFTMMHATVRSHNPGIVTVDCRIDI